MTIIRATVFCRITLSILQDGGGIRGDLTDSQPLSDEVRYKISWSSRRLNISTHIGISSSIRVEHIQLILVGGSTHLKNMSQNGNLPQIGMKIKNLWNHHLVISPYLKLVLGSTLNRKIHDGLDILDLLPTQGAIVTIRIFLRF